MNFMILMTIYTLGQQPQELVMDSNLTGEDCISGMIEAKKFAEKVGGVLSCEFDNAQPWDFDE
jgi:hypothetical protein